MDFDLFYELAMPPGLARTERQALEALLEELEVADRAGFRCAWLVEHHFMRGYSHSSKPELILAAAAQRTARLRLGLGVIPLPYHHPVHVAERVATLDLLTGGRLEVGIGRGFSPREFATFGVEMAASRALTEESLAVLRASFAEGPLRHAGPRYRFDDLDIVPSVVQRPHPPLWTAAVSPESFDWAAAAELGVLAAPRSRGSTPSSCARPRRCSSACIPPTSGSARSGASGRSCASARARDSSRPRG